MKMRTLDPNFASRVRESFDRQRFMTLIGAQLRQVDPGICVIGLLVQPSLGQQHGYVHAGVTTAIADTAAGYAAYSLFPADASVLTVEFKINLLAPADAHELVARAKVLKSGKTITVVQSEVFGIKDGKEKCLAAMQATMICLVNTLDMPPMNR